MRKIDLLSLGVALCCSMQAQQLPAQSAPAAVPGPKTEQTPAETATPPVMPPPPLKNSARMPASKSGKGAANLSGGNPSGTPRSETGAAFIIGSEDVLGVRVWDEPNLSGAVTVGPDGMIGLPLIHEVKAAGLTTVQLEASLTERLKEFRNNPEVSVNVLQVRSRRYMLQGGVGRTGIFPLTGPTTVFEALVNGSGFKEFAKTDKIYIIRRKPDGTTDKIKFNYKEVSRGKKMEQNILIQNGDYIIVPE